MRGISGQYNMFLILDGIDKEDRVDKGVRILGIVFARLVEKYAKENKNFQKLLLMRSMKSGTAKHFGGIFEQYTDSREPSFSEIINFKFTKAEQNIVNVAASFVSKNSGYSYLGDLKKDVNFEVKLFNLIKHHMGKYLNDAYHPNLDIEEKVNNFISGPFFQPYISLRLFENLFINNKSIDPEDITGIATVPTNPPNPNLENIMKWVVNRNTSGNVNVTFFYYAYYKHKPETTKKITEYLLAYAILHELKDTNYMRDRMMSKQSKKEFEGII